ncbi:MAG: hypothetical protein U9N31_08225, partial [Candidatus Marinimicrobia bacterium]|nr:hypothetical protein [Candidatus Neomarinimicrobiota bacterium]
MKKRQRQAARRQLDQEESGTLQKEKPKSFQAEFLQGVFGDMKEMVVEPQEKIEDEFSDFEVVEIEEEPEPVHVPVEHDHVVFEDLSKR